MGIFSRGGSSESVVVASPFDMRAPPARPPIQGRFLGFSRALARQSPVFSPPSADTPPSDLERVPTEVIPSHPASPAPSLSEQERLLNVHGIKARDFAFESKLPPVPVVKKKPKVALPPAAASRDCKRAPILDFAFFRRRDAASPGPSNGVDYAEQQDLSAQSTTTRTNSQDRKSTPFNFLQASRASQRVYTNPLHPLTDSQEYDSQDSSQPQSASLNLPSLDPTSQNESDDELVNTPIVSPTVSLLDIRVDPSDVPSQLAASQEDSQSISMEDISESQMGIPEYQDAPQELSQPTAGSVQSSNLRMSHASQSTLSSMATPKALHPFTTSGISSPMESSAVLLRAGSSRLLLRRASRSSFRGLISPRKGKNVRSYENETLVTTPGRYPLRNKGKIRSSPPQEPMRKVRRSDSQNSSRKTVIRALSPSSVHGKRKVGPLEGMGLGGLVTGPVRRSKRSRHSTTR